MAPLCALHNQTLASRRLLVEVLTGQPLKENKFRRGLYTTWRRSNPYPSMATFDHPTAKLAVSRSRTNTPLQALVTLNDPVYIEAAQALARRMYTSASREKSVESGIAHGFRICLYVPAVHLNSNVWSSYLTMPSLITNRIKPQPPSWHHSQ